MKKTIGLICILMSMSIPVFAGQYDIFLKDGTKLNVDSYRKADGGIYYPGAYGIEGFVGESEVIRIVNIKRQSDINHLVEEMSKGDENSIDLVFRLIAERLASYINSQGEKKVFWDYYNNNTLRLSITELPYGEKNDPYFSREYLTSFTTDIDTFKFSLDKTDSVIFPYMGTLQFEVLVKNIPDNYTVSRSHMHIYRFSKDRKKWELFKRECTYTDLENARSFPCSNKAVNFRGYKYQADDGCLFDEKALGIQDGVD